MKSGRAITALHLHSTQPQTNTLRDENDHPVSSEKGRGNYTTSEGCIRKVCGSVWEWQGDSLHIILTLLKQGKADTCGLTILNLLIYNALKIRDYLSNLVA